MTSIYSSIYNNSIYTVRRKEEKKKEEMFYSSSPLFSVMTQTALTSDMENDKVPFSLSSESMMMISKSASQCCDDPYHELDLELNLVWCSNCHSKIPQDPVSSQAPKRPILSSHHLDEMNTVSKVSTVSDDPSELYAYFVCLVDGITTKIPLGEIDPSSNANVHCINCKGTKVQRIVDPEDMDQGIDTEHQEQVDSRKTQWNRSIKKVNNQWIEIFTKDDNRIGTIDDAGDHPVGYVPPTALIGVDNKFSERFQQALDFHEKNVHQDRVDEDRDIFAPERKQFKIYETTDYPPELIFNAEPIVERKIQILVNVPLTKFEETTVAKKQDTIRKILSAKKLKTFKLATFGLPPVSMKQINTAKKHFRLVPMTNPTSEMKALFYFRKMITSESNLYKVKAYAQQYKLNFIKLKIKSVSIAEYNKDQSVVNLTDSALSVSTSKSEEPLHSSRFFDNPQKDYDIKENVPAFAQIESDEERKTSDQIEAWNNTNIEKKAKSNNEDNYIYLQNSVEKLPSKTSEQVPTTSTTKHDMKLAIVGSSQTMSWNAYHQVKEYVEALQKENPEIEIVSGGAKGIDTIAENVAKELDIPTKVFLPEKDENGKIGWDQYKARNLQIAKYATKVVSFANPLSEAESIKCYHCARVGKDNNHFKTAGCYTGYQHGEYEVVILKSQPKEFI
jgi:hypothetical protein